MHLHSSIGHALTLEGLGSRGYVLHADVLLSRLDLDTRGASRYSCVHLHLEIAQMPTPRSRLVDVSVTPWYHCISRCVRRAFLCGQGSGHRKRWIHDRLKELVDIFAVECAGFSVIPRRRGNCSHSRRVGSYFPAREDHPLPGQWNGGHTA